MDEQPASDTRPPNDRLQRWQRVYARRVLVTDLLVILGSVATAQLIRFRLLGDQESVLVDGRWPEDVTVSYTVLSLVLTIVWMITLQVLETRDHRIIGAGFTEYKRILDSTVGTFGVFAMVALMLKISTARGYLFIAFPLGLLLLLVSRFLWRSWLNARRRDGRFQYRAVIVGELAKVLHVAREITREPNAGYQIVGAVTERLNGDDCEILGVVHQSPTLSPEAILAVLDELGADTLVLTSSDTLGPEKMRSLSWTLEERDVELVVAPALTDIAGPRIHTRPVAGLPLIHIEFPEFTGRRYWAKRAFDIVGSGLLILLLSPVFIAVAMAVKLTSRGPLLFTHTRIGQHGEPFKMHKFRSMVPGADAQLAELLAEQGTTDRPLFKVQNDPRITPVGRFIRRYSLDELPQLFNAFLGSMSLVGPRPQVEAEVELYDNAAYRRLLVKPGLTGLWQVSGRSNLSWEDALRLDLYYVENWSLTGDIIILGRTFKAVLSPDGAV